MSSKKLKNEMQEATNANTQQGDEPDLPNNMKTIHPSQINDKAIKGIYNDLTNTSHTASYDASNVSTQELQCDAKDDGKCEGEITEYNHLHFNCLAAGVPGKPSTHNFYRYHYDNAINCPVHPCFNRMYF